MKTILLILFAALAAPAQILSGVVSAYGNAPTQVATPTFSPTSGSACSNSCTITVNDVDSGLPGYAATYCTNASADCTPGTSYTGAVTFSTSGTHLCAFANATGKTQSTTYCETYTVTSTTPSVTSNYKIQRVTAGGSTFTLTGINATAGSTIWFSFGSTDVSAGNDCSSATWTLGGSISNANWTQIGTNAGSSRGYTCNVQFYSKNVSTISSGTITITPSVGYTGGDLAYAEVSNVSTTAPLVTSCAANAGSASPAQCSGTVGPSSGTAVVIMAVENYYPTTGWTGANSFVVPASGSVSNAAIAWRTATSAVQPSITYTGSTNTTVVAAVLQ